ncbi:hypothetical protein EJ04DRAFT_85802 [Polyplosphaeria fusca]|uniref:AHC1-like C2H2 zinc-finger domain-containing protein n=1 Tax=Polyplosphaeria fusca TaxID=682080 RepID=A0A9P4UW38_9PLEO|nr:hypothetical protein EJ04DRAFT_85802 [Polyplosphaeria fusca]
MQSMFRLPWSTEPGDKIMEKAALHKPRPLPVVDMPNFMTKLKRKATDSPEPAPSQHAHVVKKWKNAQGEVKPVVTHVDRPQVVDGVMTESAAPVESQTPVAASAEISESRPKLQPSSRKEGASKSKATKTHKPAAKPDASSTNPPTTAMEPDTTSAQQAIEAQFNYEILLKHNELRLIEQELAKCQVALEQLRRCSLIPFPGADGLSEDLSRGVGAALQPAPGYTEPEHAAPWGVTDGPYTRHYARWLIPDPKFDSQEKSLLLRSQSYLGYGEGRATRGSFAEFASGKARTSRTSTGTLKLQALGENPAPAPKVDPLLHKRSTDGQWVRLYCSQCGHSNFSNTQGFLNHCRIKHSQVFKSHDQAAIACGVLVDINEVGNPTTATEPTPTTATTPAAAFPASSTPGFVHPLVGTNTTKLAKDVHRDFNKAPSDESASKPAPKSAFAPSSTTPHLASLLSKRGFDGNLKQMVETARQKVDLTSMETSDDDFADSVVQTPVSAKPQQLVRLPVCASHAAPASKAPMARPGSHSGQPVALARLPISLPPPVDVKGSMLGNGHRMPRSPVDLSPHTVESNPGLVSDHDDDEDEDGYDAKSQPDVVVNDDVLVEDASDVEGVEQRTGSRKGLGGFDKGEGSRKQL